MTTTFIDATERPVLLEARTSVAEFGSLASPPLGTLVGKEGSKDGKEGKEGKDGDRMPATDVPGIVSSRFF